MRNQLLVLFSFFTFQAVSQVPTITSLSQLSGVPNSYVEITGTNFSPIPSGNIVFFGKAQAQVLYATSTTLTVQVPIGAVSNEFISVEANNLVGYYSLPFKIVFPSQGTLKWNSFYNSGAISTGPNSHPTGIAIGEFDGGGGGPVEVVVANSGGNTVSVFPNWSSGYGVGPNRWDPWYVASSPFFELPTLGSKIDFTTGPNPKHVAVGDLDNDGKLDLAVANGNSLSLLKNNGTAGIISFAGKVDILGASFFSVIVDFDADGKSDLAVATAGGVAVLRNIGTSGVIDGNSFAPPVFVSGPALTLAVGDLNSDGRLDLATSYGRLLYNTSTPGVVAFDELGVVAPSNPTNVVIDNGRTLIGDMNTGEVSSFLEGPIMLDKSPSIALIDFDGDGRLDIASSKAAVVQNLSDFGVPIYSAPVTFTVGSTGSNSVAVGDINGDGLPDLVVSSYDDNTITVLVNAVPPPLPQPPVITDFSPISGNVGTTVTINGHGFSSTLNENIVFFGATQATVVSSSFGQVVVQVPSGATYEPISVLVRGQQATTAFPFIVTFPSRQTIDAKSFGSVISLIAGSNPKGVAFNDLNGDGKPDLIVANRNTSTISIFKNNNNGGALSSSSFELTAELDAHGVPYGIDVDDIDGDGRAEIVIALGSGFSLFKNLCSAGSSTLDCLGYWGSYFTSASDDGSRGNIMIEDLNGDGKPEIITSGNTTVSIFKNTGYLNVMAFDDPAVTLQSGSQVISNGVYHDNYLAAGDLDGDGKADLVVTNMDDNTISLFTNASVGSGSNISFYGKIDFATSLAPAMVTLGDLDEDGRVDLVTCNAQNISVLRNKGGAPFPDFDAKVDLPTPAPTNVAISDIDGDGKPDLIVSNPGQPSVGIFKNNASAGSVAATSFALKAAFTNFQTTNTFVAAGDLNADGRPDLVISSSSNTLSILENTVPLVAPIATIPAQSNFTSFTANWNSVIGATSYEIDVSLDNFSTLLTGFASKNETNLLENVTGLVPGTTYQYRVRANAGSSTSDNSNIINVTLPIPVPLVTNATNILETGFTANWNSIVEATTYQLDISTDNFNTFVQGYYSKNVTGGASISVIGLSPGTTYQYRVRAVFGATSSLNSNTITVTTLTIPAPVATGATAITETTFVANWNSVVRADYYLLDVSSDNFVTFVADYHSKSVSGTSQSVSSLTPGVKYQYRVRAVITPNASIFSNVVTATTLLIPAPTATDATNLGATSFIANWTSVNNAINYQLDVSSDNFITYIPGYQAKTVSGVSQLITGLSRNTPYQFRVRSVTSDGISSNSNVIFVQTLSKLTQVISFGAVADITIGDPSITLLATASSGLPVSFISKITPAALTGNIFKLILPGRDTIVAYQSGSPLYEPANPVFQTFCINPAKPIITISNDNTATPTLSSSANIGNQWQLNGTAIANETGKTLSVKGPGVYSVVVTVDDCRSKPSDDFPIIVTAETVSRTIVALFPNPTTDVVYVTGARDLKALNATDILGRCIAIPFDNLSSNTQGDVSKLNPGVYIMQVTDGQTLHQLKFIKQ